MHTKYWDMLALGLALMVLAIGILMNVLPGPHPTLLVGAALAAVLIAVVVFGYLAWRAFKDMP